MRSDAGDAEAPAGVAASFLRRAAARPRRMFRKIDNPGTRSAKSRRGAAFEQNQPSGTDESSSIAERRASSRSRLRAASSGASNHASRSAPMRGMSARPA